MLLSIFCMQSDVMRLEFSTCHRICRIDPEAMKSPEALKSERMKRWWILQPDPGYTREIRIQTAFFPSSKPADCCRVAMAKEMPGSHMRNVMADLSWSWSPWALGVTVPLC